MSYGKTVDIISGPLKPTAYLLCVYQTTDLLNMMVALSNNKQNARKGRSVLEKHVMGIEELLASGLDEAMCPGVVKQRLYRSGDLLSMPTKAGYTSLHYACGAGIENLVDLQKQFRDPAIVTRLLQIILSYPEVDVNVSGKVNHNCLYCQMYFIWLSVSFYIKYDGGGGIYTGLVDQMTALHLAAKHSSSCDVIRVLLDAGADVTCLDAYNRTPLMYALRASHLDVAAVLLQDTRTPALVPGEAKTNALAIACGVPANEYIIKTLLDRTRIDDPEFESLNVHHLNSTAGSCWVSQMTGYMCLNVCMHCLTDMVGLYRMMWMKAIWIPIPTLCALQYPMAITLLSSCWWESPLMSMWR